MLPVLATQLQQVTRQVEEAVVRVCGSFQDMAERARTASQITLVQDASGNGNQADKGGIQGLISDTRETLGTLLQRIEQTSTFSAVTVERMGTMEGQIEGLDCVLREVDEVAKNARVLALNGQLEAARAGSRGAAFSVVATETAKMAVHALTSAKTIRQMIETISRSIGSSSKELRERALVDTREAAMSRAEVNRSLDAMAALHEEMQQGIVQSNRNSDQLARDISQAVMALQFQDSVSQRIGHVVQTLEEMYAAIQSQLDAAAAPSASHQPECAPSNSWAGRMADQYTMASEREVLAAHALPITQDAGALENNVELF
jgi:methyl-accepting chemotaxis protein